MDRYRDWQGYKRPNWFCALAGASCVPVVFSLLLIMCVRLIWLIWACLLHLCPSLSYRPLYGYPFGSQAIRYYGISYSPQTCHVLQHHISLILQIRQQHMFGSPGLLVGCQLPWLQTPFFGWCQFWLFSSPWRHSDSQILLMITSSTLGKIWIEYYSKRIKLSTESFNRPPVVILSICIMLCRRRKMKQYVWSELVILCIASLDGCFAWWVKSVILSRCFADYLLSDVANVLKGGLPHSWCHDSCTQTTNLSFASSFNERTSGRDSSHETQLWRETPCYAGLYGEPACRRLRTDQTQTWSETPHHSAPFFSLLEQSSSSQDYTLSSAFPLPYSLPHRMVIHPRVQHQAEC